MRLIILRIGRKRGGFHRFGSLLEGVVCPMTFAVALLRLQTFPLLSFHTFARRILLLFASLSVRFMARLRSWVVTVARRIFPKRRPPFAAIGKVVCLGSTCAECLASTLGRVLGFRRDSSLAFRHSGAHTAANKSQMATPLKL